MEDYTRTLPKHIEKYIGENDLFLEIYEGEDHYELIERRPPLLFVHGAYTGSWMWSKYIPHFVKKGFTCYVMNMRSHYKSRVMDMTRITFN
jgi:pimeloyl-ACP methyl ester carboxylesterase